MPVPNRERAFGFRTRPHEARRIEAAAEERRVTLSEFLREAALERATTVLADPRDRRDRSLAGARGNDGPQ